MSQPDRWLVAEFFAGIGLMRLALERAGPRVVWANDIDATKRLLYVTNFGEADFLHADIRVVGGGDIPDVDLATASFPCTDLSLAGNRLGFQGKQSGLFWEFARVLREMGTRRPFAVLLENVPSFATSRGGDDLRIALATLNELGYWCDLLVVDARHFVPQSRPRLFIVGAREPLAAPADWQPTPLRPTWLSRFVRKHPELQLNPLPLMPPARDVGTLADVVDRLDPDDPRWWDAERLARFLGELSPLQRARLEALTARRALAWATAYRRTRAGRPAWEIRADAISGCLRTARGGSSKQALVEAGGGAARARWMTAAEYARLQGAAGYRFDTASEGQAQFGFGDAVCVPVVAWLAETYLCPLLSGALTTMRREALAGVI